MVAVKLNANDAVERARIRLLVPESWSNPEKGDFFENFVASLLRPMNYEVTQRIRVTGMEIDVLATEFGTNRRALVECKAQENNVAADTITKLMGNRALEGADTALLFSTSELTKDGKGANEKIKADKSLSRQFVWYSPEAIIKLLLRQNKVVHPERIVPQLTGFDVGEFVLLVTPMGWLWVVELTDSSLPIGVTAFAAKDGKPINGDSFRKHLECAVDPFSEVPYCDISVESSDPMTLRSIEKGQAVAKIIPGDSWADPRPARPEDFVGRQDLIKDIITFLSAVRVRETNTRVFSIEGPSGWGKSSLILKLAKTLGGRRHRNFSVTTIDTRSATNVFFVAEALRTAFVDAQVRGLIADEENLLQAANRLRITSHLAPLESPDIKAALLEVQERESVIVLVFDQFEELFTNQSLIEIFNLVLKLCTAIDSEQLPIVLGFSWKTDVSVPQDHPGYHFWQRLRDRRMGFRVKEFGVGDIKRIITKAEKAFGTKLTPAIRSRLIEQCQGLPWLLKKLVVHIMPRLDSVDSSADLLERELDIESLFKVDLERLTPEQIECLMFVAANSPASIVEAESMFPVGTTNSLIEHRLIIRSGANFAVYWDIFRDYLVDQKVPQIPWARTFGCGPRPALRMLEIVQKVGPCTILQLAEATSKGVAPCQNILTELFALQLVKKTHDGRYEVTEQVDFDQPVELAGFVMAQLKRHLVYAGLVTALKPNDKITNDEYYQMFRGFQAGATSYSSKTCRMYANNLQRWLVYAGLLDRDRKLVVRPTVEGKNAGLLQWKLGATDSFFLAATGPKKLLQLIDLLTQGPVDRPALIEMGLRNALYDANALGVVGKSAEGIISLNVASMPRSEIVTEVKTRVLNQPAIRVVANLEESDVVTIASKLQGLLRTEWKPSSQKRYVSALQRYLVWARD